MEYEEFIEIELGLSLGFMIEARKDRFAGNKTAATREELRALRAYHEALHLFKVLRGRMSQAGVRRLAAMIKQTGRKFEE